jgi:hypothetical protein
MQIDDEFINKSNLKIFVRGAYDIQILRIQMGNRIVANFKAKLGQKPSSKEDEMEEKAIKLIDDLRHRYKKITDGIKEIPTYKKFVGDEVISNYTELCLLHQYIQLEREENAHFRKLESILQDYPIYTEYLKSVRGVGPAISGIIISEFNISKAKYPSSLWMYCGLDVAPDGKGRSKKTEHLVDKEYTDKDGEIKIKKSITFKPFIKTKLLQVLGGSFLKVGENPYHTIYDNYKNRLENHAIYKDTTKLHRHNMAIRYMIKQFLVDLYVAWRTLEGLEVAERYEVAKLGMKPHKSIAVNKPKEKKLIKKGK